jgi:transposase
VGKKGEIQNTYPPEIKLEAIRLHLDEGVPYKSIMSRFGIIDESAVKTWVREYRDGKRNFSTNRSIPHLTYAPELKLEAARLNVEMGLTYNEIISKLGISSKSILKKWVRQYRQGEREFLNLRGRNSKGRPRKDPNDTEARPKTNQQIEAKLRRLEMENALLKKAWAELRR